jgi:hypothetical protein
MQRAETLGTGHLQFGVEPAVWGVGGKGAAVVEPSIGGSVRGGVAENVDLGARVSLSGVEADAKFMFTPRNAGVIVSLAPSVGGLGIGAGVGSAATAVGYVNIQLPVLVGIPLGPHELIIGPKLVDYLLFGSVSESSSAMSGASTTQSAVGNLFCIGTSVGMAFKLTPSFQLLPEVAIAYPVAASGSAGGATSSVSALNADGVIFQVGLGLIFGS